MTDGDLLYTTSWNNLTRRPIAGHEWVEPARARELYESFADLTIVDAATRDQDGVPAPRWVIGTGTSARFRVQFFDANTTLWRLVDYDWIDERLWRWITYDYTYADLTRQRLVNDAIGTHKSAVKPDGTGTLTTITTDGNSRPTRQATKFAGRAREDYWLDRPAFGHWSTLTDPGPSAAEVAGIEAPVPNL